MVIPQALSFSVIAGLKPIYGLYTSFIPCILYFFFGSSRHLVIGPTTILSLIVYGLTKGFNDDEDRIRYAILLSFLSGAILIILRFLRAGFLTCLLSFPVSTGFISGAGILITFSQFKHMFGMKTLESSSSLIEFIKALAKYRGGVNPWTILMFAVSFAYIMILKKIKYTKYIPGPLLSLIMASLLCYGFKLESTANIDIIKTIPKGLPRPVSPFKTFADVLYVLPYAIIVSLIIIIEGFSIAKPISSKFGYKINGNQELFSLGMANLVSSFFYAFPSTGSLTRTAVNVSVGAKSLISGLISSIIVLFTLLFLTDLLYYIPYCVLSAIIMSGVINLFEIGAMKYIYKTQKRDFIVLLIAFIGTVLFGIELGVTISIVAQLVTLIISAFTIKLEQHEKESYNGYSDIIYFKLSTSVIYLNVESFSTKIEQIANKKFKLSRDLEEYKLYVIIDFSLSKITDTTSLKKLEELNKDLKLKRAQILFVGLNEKILEIMVKSDFIGKIGEEYFFDTYEAAINYYRRNSGEYESIN